MTRRREINLKTAFRTTRVLGASRATGWVTLAGRNRRVMLVATCEGYTKRRLWCATAFHTPMRGSEPMRADVALRASFRWEAAEMALQGLALQIEQMESTTCV